MLAKRVDNTGFEIVRSSPQIIVTRAAGTLIAGTMQLLTTDGASFENPLSSLAMAGNTWTGDIFASPDPNLPGVINPFVWVKPNAVTADMRAVCIEVIEASGQVNVPPGFAFRWGNPAGAAPHAYSLRNSLSIDDSMQVGFLVGADGSLPDRVDEGNAASLGGGADLDGIGVVIDVDTTTFKGFAVSLRTLLSLLP